MRFKQEDSSIVLWMGTLCSPGAKAVKGLGGKNSTPDLLASLLPSKQCEHLPEYPLKELPLHLWA